jgi:signal transduction histidine kinase/DNA-binding response OmpR family regulator
MTILDSSLSPTSIQILYLGNSEHKRKSILSVLRKSRLSCHFLEVNDTNELHNFINAENLQVIVISIPTEKFDLLSLVRSLRSEHPSLPVLVISDLKNIEVAVEAVRAGASDFFSINNLEKLLPTIIKELKGGDDYLGEKNELSAYELYPELILQNRCEIYVLEPDTLNVLYINPTAIAKLGLSKKEAQSLILTDIYPTSQKGKTKTIIESLSNPENRLKKAQVLHKSRNGAEYPVEIVLQMIEIDGRNLISYMASHPSDGSDDIGLHQDLLKTTEKLAVSNEYKSQFLARIGHELRTPLNSINLLSRLLLTNKADNLTKDQINNLKAISKSGEALLELINEILDFSQVEAGEIKIQLETTNLEKIFGSLKTLFSPIFSNKGLNFVTEFGKNVTRTIFTDSIRLEQILKNLLSNAGKFTESGTIKLTAYRPETGEIESFPDLNTETVAIAVSDTGIGIPKEKHEMVFEAFRQTDTFTQRTYGGTGLGLSISRELTGLLGGKLTLESEVGTGSTFTLYIPVDCRAVLSKHDYKLAETGNKNSTSIDFDLDSSLSLLDDEDGQTESKKILLVDDSKIHASALKELFESDKLACIVAGTAKETYQALKAASIDCIILDLVLPDATGFEVLKELKRDEKFKEIPVIVYSAKSLTDWEQQQLEKNADAVILKTSKNFNRLHRAVQGILKQ